MTLAIYGAGGLGSDVYILAKQMEFAGTNFFEDIIYLTDNVTFDEFMGCPVISFIDFTKKYNKDNAKIVIAVGEPRVREILANKVCENDFSLATLIHPQVYVCENTEIASGCIISQGTFVGANTKIGKNTVVISANTSIGHDINIGENCVVGGVCVIGGNTKIADNVYIGGGASVREHITIGEKVVVSMGAFVTRDLEEKDVAIGNPARVMRKNSDEKVF